MLGAHKALFDLNLPVVSGTYKVGMWANIDFTVTPLGVLTTTGAWNNIATDNTTYRIYSSSLIDENKWDWLRANQQPVPAKK